MQCESNRPESAPLLRRVAHGTGAAAPGRRTTRQLFTFGAIGIASTLTYAVLFVVFRGLAPAAAANAAALLVTAFGNTAANRRLTFDIRGCQGLVHDYAAGMLALGAALTITSSTLYLLYAVDPEPGHTTELLALLAANGLATLVRFLLLRLLLERRVSRTAVDRVSVYAAEARDATYQSVAPGSPCPGVVRAGEPLLERTPR